MAVVHAAPSDRAENLQRTSGSTMNMIILIEFHYECTNDFGVLNASEAAGEICGKCNIIICNMLTLIAPQCKPPRMIVFRKVDTVLVASSQAEWCNVFFPGGDIKVGTHSMDTLSFISSFAMCSRMNSAESIFMPGCIHMSPWNCNIYIYISV